MPWLVEAVGYVADEEWNLSSMVTCPCCLDTLRVLESVSGKPTLYQCWWCGKQFKVMGVGDAVHTKGS